ncbi:MAG: TraX family protein [Leptolyngbya foveolarum]|uniref:TraX family protein n=1 Tax=Leptolyngbya foveolarum TaxID=47253 RepID=A0A2W4UDJ8_9CYAN|nr:MAG: TraX family protein [Leptolyngbya foveolarum]
MTGLNSHHLKLIAAVSMLLDHIGVVLYPEIDWLRMVGRISFPLFAWLLVQGEAHTRNVWRYGLRLGLLGLISQPIYQIAFDVATLNILFHLLIGLVCLRTSRAQPKWTWPIWIAGGLIAEVLNISYGGYGIALILLLRYFRNRPRWWMAWVGLHLVSIPLFGTFQLPTLPVPFLWMAYNPQRGAKARWFYAFYPAHLLLLVLIHASGVYG